MPKPSAPTQGAQKAVRTLAQKFGLALSKDATKLGDRPIAITVLYSGGNSLARLLDGAKIAFAQCGSRGEWVAVLPAEELVKLLEIESVHNNALNLREAS
jgi:hypothetical protein